MASRIETLPTLALAVPQPIGWALAHGKCDVINEQAPAPAAVTGATECGCCYCDEHTVNAEDDGWVLGLEDDAQAYYACPEHSDLLYYPRPLHPVPRDVLLCAGSEWDGAVADRVQTVTGRKLEQSEGKFQWRGIAGVRNPYDGIIWWQPFNAAVAIATVSGSHPAKKATGTEPGCCSSPWAEFGDGVHHWQVTVKQVFDRPTVFEARPTVVEGLDVWAAEADLLERVEAEMIRRERAAAEVAQMVEKAQNG